MNEELFKNAKVLGVDIETYDPHLADLGPSVYRSKPRDFNNDKGYILGVSFADNDGNKIYLNIGHYDCSDDERNKNINIIKRLLESDLPKVGANIMYDIDWIENWLLLKVNGQLYDVQTAEALIDDHTKSYALSTLSLKYLGEDKAYDELIKFCEANNLKLNAEKKDASKWLYKAPYSVAKKYAEVDAVNPIFILKKQWEILKRKNLLNLFHFECDLLRVNVYMRKVGVKINTLQRDKNALISHNIYAEAKEKLIETYGDFNINSTKQIAAVFDKLDIVYPRTDIGNPSINKEFLTNIASTYEIAKMLLTIRKAAKMRDTFLLGSYIDFLCEGDLIHCSFYNTRNDFNGTRSGRLSSAKPNLQQIPSKGVDTFWGGLCRQPFVPKDDNYWWVKFDYSQIEYRFIAHYAVGEGSTELRSSYNKDPQTDYHQYIIDLTGLKRRFAKNLNFGVAYGMGANTMASFFDWTLDYAHEILDIYNEKAPYVRSTSKHIERHAINEGYVTTILGRRSRLINKNDAYKMLCRVIQGSAADLMKKAMYSIYMSNVLDCDVIMHLTVHDELDFSIRKGIKGLKAIMQIKHLMENALVLKVPIKTDVEMGPNWADLKELDIELTDDIINDLSDEDAIQLVNDNLKNE